MTKNIAIVANYNKTLFFKKIADYLEASQDNNVSVFWICVSNFWYQRLIKDGVDPSKVLYLPRSIIENRIVDESSEYQYRINELIYSDRVFRHEPEFGEKYLQAIQPHVRNFIKTNSIKNIFSECTWAHEALFNRMCLQEKELKCRFLKPHTIRIPNQRFAFFEDEFESRLFEIAQGEEKDWEFELKKPDYFHLNDEKNKLSARISGLKSKITLALSAEKHDREDPTQRLSRIKFFTSKVLSEINYYIYKFGVSTLSLDQLPKRYWVYYLHKQPEASIDIVGRYFENQYENIVRLSKMLPDGCYLLVKEHSNAIGDRPYSFYKDIKKIQRVDLVDEQADSFTLIQQADKTITVSGTVAYEAGLLEKPTLVLSPVFYSLLPSIEVIGQEVKVDKTMSVSQFKRYVYKHSFPGVISDPVSDSRCVSNDNIALVSNAFMQVINND